MFSHPRLKAIRRLAGEAYWCAISARRWAIRLRLRERVLVDIEALEVSRGEARLRGVSARVQGWFRSDLASIRVEVGQTDISLACRRHLSFQSEAEDSVAVPLYRWHHRLRAAFRLAVQLAAFPLRHGSDLLAYALRGDSSAGERLERALLPHRFADSAVPEAAEGLFGHRDLPMIVEPVDIILPVHNAAEVLAICLDHLARHTPEPHRLWLMDDASSDPAVPALLADFVARHPAARLLVNAENLGFVGTVNRGLTQATGHVVLLNSDALVPEGWLTLLLAPVLSDVNVASVTPLSNDAEIASVPLACRPRKLAAGEAEGAMQAARTLDWRAALAEVPTGVGFCMAMARPWLDLVPDLDPVFGLGYGEEVDWCRKTAALGARHVATAGLFVEHRAGSSFGPSKAARIQKNNQVISARYPEFDGLVDQFRQSDPLAGPRIVQALGMAGQGGPIKVYLAHRLGGGAEHWLRDAIAEDLGGAAGVVVLRDAPERQRVVVEVHVAEGATRAFFHPGDLPNLMALLPDKHLIYSCLVGAGDPLALVGRTVGSLAETDRFTVLFHDFLPLCPSYNLISAEKRFCDLPEPSACQSCYQRLPVTSGKRPALIGDWRAGWQEVLNRATETVTFSRSSRALVLRVWPDLERKMVVRPHRAPDLPAVVASERAGLVLGVLGNIGQAKGAEILQALAGESRKDLHIVVLGTVDAAYGHPALTVYGRYQRAEIGALAERYRISAWLIPSIWPETFSFTAHEALATGLPVLAFDLGAQGEAVTAAPNGLVLPLGQPLDAQTVINAVATINATLANNSARSLRFAPSR